MIKLLLRLPVALLLALGITWAAVLALSRGPDTLLGCAHEDLVRALPDPEARTKFLAEEGTLGPAPARILQSLGSQPAPLLRAGLLVSQLHGALMLRLLPIFALAGGAGLAAGLALRERMRDEEGYASPSAAGLGRLLVGTGVFWIGLFSACPIPVSCGWLYVSGVLASLGTLLWSANLPLKL